MKRRTKRAGVGEGGVMEEGKGVRTDVKEEETGAGGKVGGGVKRKKTAGRRSESVYEVSRQRSIVS